MTIEKLLVTHGHIDHCGATGILADELGVSVEGPHEEDRFWIARLGDDGRAYGIEGRPFEPDRWLTDGDQVSVGELVLDVHHCPGHTPGHYSLLVRLEGRRGHTPGHIVFHHAPSALAIVGDVLFQGSIGRTDFPRGDHAALIEAITTKLWPMGGETRFVPGHGPMSSFAHERQSNPFVGDAVLRG